MSQLSRSQRAESAKKGSAESQDPNYVPRESSPLTDPMRGVRTERAQAAAQMSRTLKLWRKADGPEDKKKEEEPEEKDAQEAESEEAKGGPDDQKGDKDKKKPGEEGEEAEHEEGKEGEEKKGDDQDGKKVARKAEPGAKVFLARDGTPGNNQAQNKQFDDACKEIEKQIGRKLSKDDRRKLHDEITGQDMGFQDLVQHGVSMFKK